MALPWNNNINFGERPPPSPALKALLDRCAAENAAFDAKVFQAPQNGRASMNTGTPVPWPARPPWRARLRVAWRALRGLPCTGEWRSYVEQVSPVLDERAEQLESWLATLERVGEGFVDALTIYEDLKSRAA